MGSVCSCLHIEDFEEYTHDNASVYRHCICFRCLAQQLIHAYTALFRRGEVRAIPSSRQGTAPLASAALVTDDSIPDTYCAPPRPLPYDDPRCSRPQYDGLISRRDKSSSHFHEESEPLRRNSNDTEIESRSRLDKWHGSNYEGGSKLCHSESSLKHPLTEDTKGATYFFPSSEDEDVCPICLEGVLCHIGSGPIRRMRSVSCRYAKLAAALGISTLYQDGTGKEFDIEMANLEYTSENPRIIMQCTHHFHLSCIYEWFERSDACPVCGKMMVFNETT